jgi:hypothetical protein
MLIYFPVNSIKSREVDFKRETKTTYYIRFAAGGATLQFFVGVISRGIKKER